ncbi:transketolase, partial [Klebsiella pneumoniae]|nr:transketolase [Klebsiella pneumoniae]
VLSRQDLPVLENDQEEVDAGIEKGAYIVAPANSSKPDAIIIATGSEVSLAIEAKAELAKKDIDVSVVSLSSWERFEKTTD